MKNKLIINRGITWSWKSTFSQTIKSNYEETKILSTDNYFVNENWEYFFDYTKLEENHNKNYEDFIQEIQNKSKIIIIDNTNLNLESYKKYIIEWRKNNYQIINVEFQTRDISEHLEKNTHNIPIEVIENMMKKFKNRIERNLFRENCDKFFFVRANNFQKNINYIVKKILEK